VSSGIAIGWHAPHGREASDALAEEGAASGDARLLRERRVTGRERDGAGEGEGSAHNDVNQDA